jgi:2,5-dioxopentanoate dehydrogenase
MCCIFSFKELKSLRSRGGELVSSVQPILFAGKWCVANATGEFRAVNPATGEALPEVYPVSKWSDCEKLLMAAVSAWEKLRGMGTAPLVNFLHRYADAIDANAEPIAKMAATETGLAFQPRLKDLELPRTTNQIRQAAAACDEGSWAMPTLDTKNNIRSCFGSIGPVIAIGPNNFPLAYNGIAGGDFAAAIAAGNPVIAKAHPSHPTTSRMLAELANRAAEAAGLPAGTVQMLYRTSKEDGLRFVSDPRTAATGFTGSRTSGMAIKAACDAAGKPSYLEMSSINPVIILPGALEERWQDVANQFSTSCLMAAGQFCTNPGFVLLLKGPHVDSLVEQITAQFKSAAPGVLLSQGVRDALESAVKRVTGAGAELLAGGNVVAGPAVKFENTLLRLSADKFLQNPEVFQTEMFGSATLFVIADHVQQAVQVINRFEGNLTGSVYSATNGADDALSVAVSSALRPKVGRLINDKMPTGVAVSPAMNHGGPYPSTGHAGFTAVGIPAAIHRFAALHCYDQVREPRLPSCLQNANPNGKMWRFIDGNWSRENIG